MRKSLEDQIKTGIRWTKLCEDGYSMILKIKRYEKFWVNNNEVKDCYFVSYTKVSPNGRTKQGKIMDLGSIIEFVREYYLVPIPKQVNFIHDWFNAGSLLKCD